MFPARFRPRSRPLIRSHAGPLAIALLLALPACDPGVMVAGTSLVTLAYKDKTVPDYVASWAYDQDCSVMYAAYEDSYCKDFESAEQKAERERAEAEAAQTAYGHCYRTLGGVTCYKDPDPFASSYAKVN